MKVKKAVIIVLNHIFIYSFNKHWAKPEAHDPRIRQLQLFNEYRALFWRDENVLELVKVVIAQHCEYTEHHWIVLLEMVNFMSRAFLLNKKKNGGGGCVVR